LKASEIEVGILLNFGKKPELRRKVFSSSYKPNHKKSQESWVLDIRAAIEELGAMTGQSVQDDLLSEIFSTFCIGK
jgi:tRNA U34 5-carboxymethylaminomethyl modifying GTPase MnmE/TrmE